MIKREKKANVAYRRKMSNFCWSCGKMLTSAKDQHIKIKMMVQNDFFYTIIQWCQILARKNKYSKGYDILNLHSFCNNTKKNCFKKHRLTSLLKIVINVNIDMLLTWNFQKTFKTKFGSLKNCGRPNACHNLSILKGQFC